MPVTSSCDQCLLEERLRWQQKCHEAAFCRQLKVCLIKPARICVFTSATPPHGTIRRWSISSADTLTLTTCSRKQAALALLIDVECDCQARGQTTPPQHGLPGVSLCQGSARIDLSLYGQRAALSVADPSSRSAADSDMILVPRTPTPNPFHPLRFLIRQQNKKYEYS